MKRFGRVTFWVLTVLVLPVVGLAAGCQTAQPQNTRPATSAATTQPTDAMARSDAQRAEADLEQQRREGTAERRPYDPGSGRPVDQPRVGGRR